MSIALSSAVEQIHLLRTKKISPLELAAEYIRRIERLNPALNAIVDFDADWVRSQASRTFSGPLHGLPITIKSSISVAGRKCEVGSTLRRGIVAENDAEAVRRLRQAGALILGSTNCPEFLMAYESDNLLYGRTNNPWDLERTAGGSSGGEAATIAAGLSAAGLGSDSGGSVREPAHFSGICALKPTSGRISAIGHVPPCIGPFSTLGSIGPMARTIADVALIYSIAAGRCDFDPANAPVAHEAISLDEAKRVRIGWFVDDTRSPVTESTRESVEAAAVALSEQGFHVARVTAPKSFEAAQKLWDKLFVQCGAMFYEPVISGRYSDLSPVFRDFLDIAASRAPLSAASLLQAWADLDVVRMQMLEEMREHPILVTPVCASPAFRHGERSWKISGRTVGYLEAMRFMQWFNVLGSPAAVIPIGQSPNGPPIGVQIAGVPFADELVLTIAGALDQAFGYKPPPIAAS
jgi:Asp-tRNA(Asn)/Glu-tRNA(Gln) amidotransferase A subunit family amidase